MPSRNFKLIEIKYIYFNIMGDNEINPYKLIIL